MQVLVIICLFTKIVGCVCQVSHGRPNIGLRSTGTNRHHTVDKIGAFNNYNIFLYLVKLLNFTVILLNILDHVMQIYSKIIKSFALS